jgi:signal transduction histidine kinase
MKIQFKTTTLAVIVMIAGVFIYQIYLLSGLYRNLNSELEKSIYEAMGTADQNELFLRLDWLKNRSSDNEINVSASFEGDSLGMESYYMTTEKQVVINHKGDEVGFNLFKENARSAEKLAAFLQKAMHEAVDGVRSINMDIYDSLLTVELNKIKITSPYQILRIKTVNDSICATPIRQNVARGTAVRQFDYFYDIGDEHAYRLLISNPNRQLLWQMGGILISSFLILSLLVFIFIFLLISIRKLQTEEELKTDFINNITHELKTPIAVSYAAVDALLVANQPASPERSGRYLNIAKSQMKHLSGLVEQLLTMSRKNHKRIVLKPEKIYLEDLVAELIEKRKVLLDKPINIQTQFDVQTVWADKLHLTNILDNLMENGIKYSGNHVQLKISSKRDGDHVLISVQDDGIGIDARHHPKLFDRFYRVPTGNRHDIKGFGLGLFYVKQMIELHGGTIDVNSFPGRGSVFTIKIPRQ